MSALTRFMTGLALVSAPILFSACDKDKKEDPIPTKDYKFFTINAMKGPATTGAAVDIHRVEFNLPDGSVEKYAFDEGSDIQFEFLGNGGDLFEANETFDLYPRKMSAAAQSDDRFVMRRNGKDVAIYRPWTGGNLKAGKDFWYHPGEGVTLEPFGARNLANKTIKALPQARYKAQ